MAEHDRLHRENPERDAPIRNWSALYRKADSWTASFSETTTQTTAKTSENGDFSDPLSHGVKLGYQVIEEHIRQGQRIAQQINSRSYNLKNASNDVSELVDRLVRDSTNLLSLWFQFMASLTQTAESFRPASTTPQQPFSPSANGAAQHHAATASAPAQQPATVSIELVASCPTQVTLSLSPQAERLALVSPGLHALGGEKPPLTDIRFTPCRDNQPALLRLVIPPGHPADCYSGVLVDSVTGAPQGTVSVHVKT